MKKVITISILSIVSLIYSCSNDDNSNSNPPEDTTLSEIIEAITDSGDSKTWKIESASLTNSTLSNLDVTDAFNIKDDEFLFSADAQSISLEHRQRNDFNREASSFDTFLLDYYKSSLDYNLSNTTGDATVFYSPSGDLILTYENENSITGEWIFDASTKLFFSLTVKTTNEYQNVPTFLNFQEITTIPSQFEFLESVGSADVLASLSNNSIYLTYTTDAFTNPNGGNNRAEGIIRYDISNNQFNSNLFFNSDFFTKRAYISDNKLKIVGTGYINTYNNLDIIGDPETSIEYNDLLEYSYFRHDIVIVENNVVIIGGNTQLDESLPGYLDKMLLYNESTQSLDEFATLPTTKSQAAAERVDDKIYIFSGTRGFNEFETAETLSYIYDINTGSIDSFNIPEALSVSFSTVVENMIYVAGQKRDIDSDGTVTNIDIYFGAYNTEDNTFTELPHNLNDSDDFSSVSGITYVNGKLYAIYADAAIQEYVIYASNLD